MQPPIILNSVNTISIIEILVLFFIYSLYFRLYRLFDSVKNQVLSKSYRIGMKRVRAQENGTLKVNVRSIF